MYVFKLFNILVYYISDFSFIFNLYFILYKQVTKLRNHNEFYIVRVFLNLLALNKEKWKSLKNRHVLYHVSGPLILLYIIIIIINIM